MQRADLHTTYGKTLSVEVPAFPNNPPLIVLEEGIPTWGLTHPVYFVPDATVIGFGKHALSYTQAIAYTPPGDIQS